MDTSSESSGNESKLESVYLGPPRDIDLQPEKIIILGTVYSNLAMEMRWWRDRSWAAFRHGLLIQLAVAGSSFYLDLLRLQVALLILLFIGFGGFLAKAYRRYRAVSEQQWRIVEALRLDARGEYTADKQLLEKTGTSKLEKALGTPFFLITLLFVTVVLVYAMWKFENAQLALPSGEAIPVAEYFLLPQADFDS
ncbi:MAG: hypothetical protein OEU36_26215 [Gammaproteobacteria bacterium]|nr:hypothetical protein [Gammaproteobacteria bacterium]